MTKGTRAAISIEAVIAAKAAARSSHHLLRVAVSGAVILFLALGAWKLGVRGVEDEPWLAMPSYTLLHEGRLGFPAFEVGEQRPVLLPPFFFLFMAPFYAVLGFGLVQGRVLMLGLGAVTILATYAVGKEWFGPRMGIVAAFLLAADNVFFLAARTVRQEMLVACFVVVAAWCVLVGTRRRRLPLIMLAGICCGLAAVSHPNGVIGAVAVALVLAHEKGWSSSVFQSCDLYAWLAGLFLPILPYLAYLTIADGSNGFTTLSGQLRGRTLLSGDASSRMLFLWRELTERYAKFLQFPFRLHVVLILGAGFVLGLITRDRRLWTLWGIVGLFLAGFAPMVNKELRYLAIPMPFATLALAAVFDPRAGEKPTGLWPARWQGSRGWKIGLFAILGVYIVSQLVGNVYFVYRHRATDYAAFTEQIRELVPPDGGIYGPVTFWFPFRDRRYYAYNRVPYDRVPRDGRPITVLLGDRLMTTLPEWAALRRGLEDEVRSRGRFLGRAVNWFYGDITVYAIGGDAAQRETPKRDTRLPQEQR